MATKTFLSQKIQNIFDEGIDTSYFFRLTNAAVNSKADGTMPLLWEYMDEALFFQKIAVSIDTRIFMNVSDDDLSFKVLKMLKPANNPNQDVKLVGARLYIELTPEEADASPVPMRNKISHPDENHGKAVYSLHTGGRQRYSWNNLWLALGHFTTGDFIYEKNLSDFLTDNGYNTNDE